MLRLMWRWQTLSFRKVAYSIIGVYILITCYTGFHLITRKLQNDFKEKILQERIKSLSEIADDPDWNPWGEEFESEQQPRLHHDPPALWPVVQHPLDVDPRPLPLGKRSPLERREVPMNASSEQVVEIWGKAAIGLYLWEHVFGGLLEHRLNGVWSYGEKTVHSVTFRFRTGPGVVPSKVPRDTANVLLVLNGRESSKIEVSKMWLELLPTLPHLHNAAVVLLGSEVCDNSWIHPYMSFNGGPLKFVFLVYDSPEVDNVHFFQWPLGVATYRNFPDVKSSNLDVRSRRAHLFNFLGTIYKNSSREILLSAINSSSYKNLGLVKPRWEWLPQETEESQDEYMQALSQSDLTLNPVGINTECYRIYESMSLGAVPVIEDVMTPGHCGGDKTLTNTLSSYKTLTARETASRNSKKTFPAPLRLLKEYGAPVIFVKNWVEGLETLLKREKEMSDYDRLKWRENLVQWYSHFKLRMRDRLVSVTLEKFFNSEFVDR